MTAIEKPTLEATVVAARHSLESVPYAVLTIVFANSSPRAQRVMSYRIVWPDGAQSTTPHGLIVAAGETVERVVRVGADAGVIATLLDGSASARVTDICACFEL